MKRRQIPPVRKPVKNNLTSGTVKRLSEEFQRGMTLHQQGRIKDAVEIYEQILKVNPKHFDALHLLGVAFRQFGNYSKALELYEQAILINASNPALYNNRGNALKDLKRVDEALLSYDKAIALKPDYADAFSNRGLTLQDLKRLDEALLSYDKAIALKPDHADAYYNRGNALQDLKRLDEALLSYDKAIALKPDYAEAYNNRGNALKDLKRLDEALLSYDKAISLKPDSPFLHGSALYTRMHLCDWKDLEAQTEFIRKCIEDLKPVSVPFPLLAIADFPELHKIASELFIKEKCAPFSSLEKIWGANDVSKIKIGYFSSDFCNHPVTHLLAGLFEEHNRSRFEVTAFSLVAPKNDEWQQRVINGVDKFIDVSSKSDAEIATLSRALGIEIAIDLNGHTKNARTGIFAYRAAPVQASYIGYLGTMGASYFDYLIADPILIPEENQQFYTEKIAYLPFYQCNDKKFDFSKKTYTRSDFGLPEDGFVFCSFNNNYKIVPSVFDSWMRILARVPESVLWIHVDNESAKINLQKETQERGVDLNRLIFADKIPLAEHLARQRLADLMLDTFPYNAGATASNALRVGLPVITRSGKSFASRYGASLLNAVGLSELVTESAAEFESLAIEIATKPELLTKIKDNLVNNLKTSPLFNPSKFTRNLESLYERIYQRHCDGLPVDHIRIPSVAV